MYVNLKTCSVNLEIITLIAPFSRKESHMWLGMINNSDNEISSQDKDLSFGMFEYLLFIVCHFKT